LDALKLGQPRLSINQGKDMDSSIADGIWSIKGKKTKIELWLFSSRKEAKAPRDF
jgi:hypothetical protein